MNPTKISGACGRLMCCFKYEQAAYEDAHKRLPRQGDIVTTEKGRGIVRNVHMLKETVNVRLDQSEDNDMFVVAADQVEVIGSTRPPKGKKTQRPKPPRNERASGKKKPEGAAVQE